MSPLHDPHQPPTTQNRASLFLDSHLCDHYIAFPGSRELGSREPAALFHSVAELIADRLMAGRRVLAPLIKVQILVREEGSRNQRLPWPHSLAVRTSASHAEIPGSIPGGVIKLVKENRHLRGVCFRQCPNGAQKSLGLLCRICGFALARGGCQAPETRRPMWL